MDLFGCWMFMYQITYYPSILVARVISNLPDKAASYTSHSTCYRIPFIPPARFTQIIPIFYEHDIEHRSLLHSRTCDIGLFYYVSFLQRTDAKQATERERLHRIFFSEDISLALDTASRSISRYWRLSLA